MDRHQPICHNCNQLIPINTKTCPHCVAESASGLEALVPRIGELLIQQGLIQPEALDEALQIQEKLTLADEPILIGQLLVDLGFVSRQNLNQVITKHVFQLQSALARNHQRLEDHVQKQTRDLQNALLKLSELNKQQLNFVANVSHELRMPMQFLMGYIELLGNNLLGPLTEEQANSLVSMRGASQQLHQITEDLLQFSSFANSHIFLDMAPFKLDKSVVTAVSHIQPKAQSKNIHLKHQLPYLPQVIADNEKITWVVEQFLDNAIKFTPTGGEVKIETSPLRGDVLVKVTDTGIGIPDYKVPTLFATLEQPQQTPAHHKTGIGLGLALAQKIVEAHGSHIEVETSVGQGSCFSFALPALD
jgi:signal transduction histidine kinase